MGDWEMETVQKFAVQRENRVEELMDKALEHKLNEYESRLGLMESEVNLLTKQLNELKATAEVVQSDSQNLHRETIKRFVEFAEKLGEIGKEVKLVEESLHSEEKAIERIREHEYEAVSNLKGWEKKALKRLKKQSPGKKTLDSLLKKLTSGKNKGKLEKAVRNASTSVKVRTALVNSVLNDKKLRAKLVKDVLAGTRGKMKREKVTTRVAKVAAKKVMKTMKPRMRKAAKAAAKKAVKTAAKA